MTTGTENGDFLFGDDTFDFIDGKGGNDAIFGKGGTDLLLGGEGDDLLVGGRGDDALNGGAGIDTVSYADAALGIDARLTTGVVKVKVGMLIEQDTLIDVENVTGGNGDDEIWGNGQDNVLRGNGGRDVLVGLGGNDKLYGGGDTDFLVGGEGADLLDGGLGSDRVEYNQSQSGVTIDLLAGKGFGGAAEGDTLISIEVVIGSAFKDSLIGSGLTDTFIAGGGSDTLKGNDGDDWLEGGAGGDVLRGGDGVDTIDYFTSDAGVKVDLADLTASGGHATGDNFKGFENARGSELDDKIAGDDNSNQLWGWHGADVLAGRGGGDKLDGDAGNDTLKGGSGNDELRGGAGRDVLNGGSDQDRFVFSSAADSQTGIGVRDVIEDFVSGVDVISLSLIDANVNSAGNQAFSFIAGHAFNGAAGQLRYTTEGGKTILEADLDGDKTADFQIEFTGIVTFADGDIIL